jgi:hypothetical protein
MFWEFLKTELRTELRPPDWVRIQIGPACVGPHNPKIAGSRILPTPIEKEPAKKARK